MASSSKVDDIIEENTADDSSTITDTDSDVDKNDKQNNISAKSNSSDNDCKTKDDNGEEHPPLTKGRKLKSKKRRKPRHRETSSLDRTQSVETVSEKSVLSKDSKKLRKRRQVQRNKYFIDANGAIERQLEQKYMELEQLLNRQFVERKTNLTHLHIGQMEVLRQQYNLSCHGLPPAGVTPYSQGRRRRPHSAHHFQAWEGDSDEAYSAIRQIQQMSKFPQRRKVRSKSAKSRGEINSDTDAHQQRTIDINLETASLSSARSPRAHRKRTNDSSIDRGSRRSHLSPDSTSPPLSPSRGYIPTDNHLKNTDDKRIKEWLRKKNRELRKQRSAERAKKKEERKESILKENEKIITRESGRAKVEEWMNRKKREAIEQKKAERLRHRQLQEEQKEREAKKKMDHVQGKSWNRPASAPASRSKNKSLLSSSTDDPSTSNDGDTNRPIPHPPSSKLIYKRSSTGRVRLRAKNNDKIETGDSRPPTEKSLESSQLTYSEWLEKKRKQDAEKKKADAEAKASAKSDSDLDNLLPELHKNRVSKVLKSKKKVDSGQRNEDDTQASLDKENSTETFLTVNGAKAELSSRYSYPRPQSAKLPSPQPCKSPKRPKSAHPRVDSILAEEKEEPDENPFHLPFPAHLGVPKEVAKTQSKVFPERVAAERRSLEESVKQKSEQLPNESVTADKQIEVRDIQEKGETTDQNQEESPRVGASFFITDDNEQEISTELETPETVTEENIYDETQQPFLESSPEKPESDKDNQATENRNGNNSSSNLLDTNSSVASGVEVNVTELPSKKIPTLDMDCEQGTKLSLGYKQDVFETGSSESDDDDDNDDDDDHHPDLEANAQKEGNDFQFKKNTQLEEQKQIAANDIPKSTLHGQVLDADDAFESAFDEKDDKIESVDDITDTSNTDVETDDSLKKTEQTQQLETPEQMPTEDVEQNNNEINEESGLLDDQSFLETGQVKHEPDKFECGLSILQQVMETLPSSEDDSRGEASSAQYSTKLHNERETSKIDDTGGDSKQVGMVTQQISHSFDHLENQITNEENESVLPRDTFADAAEELTDVNGPVEDNTKHPEIQYQQNSTDDSVVQPLTPTLGRHLSNEELLANIQAGKKLISIPEPEESTNHDEPKQGASTGPFHEENKDSDSQPATDEKSNLISFYEPNDPSFGKDSGQSIDGQTNNQDQSIIDHQQELKQTTLSNILNITPSPNIDNKEQSHFEPLQQSEKSNNNKVDIDDMVINDQKDLKQASLQELQNSQTIKSHPYEPLTPPGEENSDTESEIEENIFDSTDTEDQNHNQTRDESEKAYEDFQRIENHVSQEEKPALFNSQTTESNEFIEETQTGESVQDITHSTDKNQPTEEATNTGQIPEKEEQGESHSTERSLDSFLDSQLSNLPRYNLIKPLTNDFSDQTLIDQKYFSHAVNQETDTSEISYQSSQEVTVDDLQKRLERLRSSDDLGSDVTDTQDDIPQPLTTDDILKEWESPKEAPYDPNGQIQTAQEVGSEESSLVPISTESISQQEVSDTESDSNEDSQEDSDDLNNNKVDLPYDNQGAQVIESVDGLNSTNEKSFTKNNEDIARNLENEINVVPDNRREEITEVNQNLKPILSQSLGEDTSVNDNTSSPQKRVSFSQNPIIIQEDGTGVPQREINSDSDAVEDVLRTML